MSRAAALLAALDAAMPDEEAAGPGRAGDGRAAGVAAAAGLNDLLTRHGLVWDNVIAPGSRLAKLCGRFGSEYPAEREAAYDHALRLLLRRRVIWSDLVRLPEALLRVPAPLMARRVRGEAGRAPIKSAAVSPPERDWMATVQRLRACAAWRSDAEHDLLDELERSLASGQAVSAEDARRLRDIWWCAELNDTGFEEMPG